MTDFSLVIKLDGAAFEDTSELSSILRRLSRRVDELSVRELLALGSGSLRDVNGNTVGMFKIDPNNP
jgi:hypothetical protein